MVRGLAVETSGSTGSIALTEDGSAVAARRFAHGLQHAAGIICIIDELCRERGWTPGQLQQLYVSAGPGSFTGLRIGITLAKTLALATGAKLVAVPSVRVLVENAPEEAPEVVIVLDARRQRIYTARFRRRTVGGDSGPQAPRQWCQEEPAHLDTLPAVLGRAGRPVYLLGEGIPYHEKSLPQGDPGVIVTAPSAWQARAEALGRLGWEMAIRGELVDPLSLTPIYIRPPEAQEKYAAMRQGSARTAAAPSRR
jgi:tRNA threonylcarbamoyladenosine biosynthesis protein TsaB